MAIRIQRQVGGNLAELLDTVAGHDARAGVHAPPGRPRWPRRASSRPGSWAACPPAFMLYLLLTKRDYVMPMFTEPMGWMMLAGAAMLLERRRLLDEPAREGGGVR